VGVKPAGAVLALSTMDEPSAPMTALALSDTSVP